ncbi:MAG: ABC transporter ATP-binding protein [Clostridia bacterium]|nr:ABC transporter ATP-binding protein [Clostridia bacterium]
MFKRFLSYYKPHKKIFALDMLASLAVSMIGVLYPMMTRTMLNDLIPNRKYSLIIIFGVSLLAVYIIRMLLDYFIQYQGHMMGVNMQARMRSDMFNHLEKLPFSFFDNHETGKIKSRLTNDLTDISELAHHGPESVIIATITVVVSFAYLATINIWLALIVFLCVPILIVVAVITRKKMTEAFRESRRSVAEINAALESSISGIRVTKAFTNSEKESEKFEKGNERFKEARRSSYKAMGEFHSSTTFVTNVFNVVVLISGGLFMYAGEISFADYSAFVVSIGLFLNPINTVIRFMEMFQNGVAGFERFVEIMDTPVENDGGKIDAARLEGKIEFKNVSCSYDNNRKVLKSVNLSVDKGKTFALVGPSGGGKTTICHLIPHFYDVSEGTIYIDGMDIRDLSLASLRRNIGIVQQDIYLFNASVRDNILYGRLDATEEEIIEAAKRANIHDYIMTMENGYDTVIGERGVRLSGGQKQRLCIARVFLKNPPILILDEATSALDNATEILIQKSLDELCIGRTTLVVAHRLSTIKNASEIAVIDDGKIIEQGSHEDLLANNGMYAELYNKQFKE